MNTATVTKPAIEALVELGIELDLSAILAEELEQGLSSDINNCF